MKKWIGLCAALLIVFSALPMLAADVTGAWTGSAAGPGGDAMNITFNFKQDGTKLTGSIVGPQGDPIDISNGKVDGDNVSFAVVREFNYGDEPFQQELAAWLLLDSAAALQRGTKVWLYLNQAGSRRGITH